MGRFVLELGRYLIVFDLKAPIDELDSRHFVSHSSSQNQFNFKAVKYIYGNTNTPNANVFFPKKRYLFLFKKENVAL